MDIPLNSDNTKNYREYSQIRTKLFIRVLASAGLASVITFVIYYLFIRKRFAEWLVGLLCRYFDMNYYAAVDFYQSNIRIYMNFFIAAAVIAVFAVILYFLLNKFLGYFCEINKQIDSLIEENENEVKLPSELAATEIKLNTIKHTLSRRKLDAKLAEQRKNELVVYLAHDLKTPLTSVIGYLNLLKDEKEISPQTRDKYISIALEKSGRLEELINELFDIARLNISEVSLELKKVNLTRLLEQLTFEFEPMLSEKSLAFSLDFQPDIMLVCDADKLQRVFDNLLRNAVFYCYPQSTISISAFYTDKKAIISFKNRGETIPEEKLMRLFEQFYRADSARGTQNGGAGLGLAIAKQIVELHGGEISVKSQNESIEFTVSLPLTQKN